MHFQAPQYVPTMSDERRAMFLKIWSGYEPVHRITNALYHIYAHFPEDKVDKALRWLILNKKTGINFVSFWYECGGSDLSLHRKLLAILENEKVSLKIVAGRNFRI